MSGISFLKTNFSLTAHQKITKVNVNEFIIIPKIAKFKPMKINDYTIVQITGGVGISP